MSRANEIAIAYAKGLADAVRKKNTDSLFAEEGGPVVQPDELGSTEIDDGTIEEILAAQSEAPSADQPPAGDVIPEGDESTEAEPDGEPMPPEKKKPPFR